MPNAKKFKDTLSILAMLATIIGVVLAIVTTLFPDLITNATKQAIDFDQYKTLDGAIRATVVEAQTNVFFIAAGIIVFLAGLALANLYFLGTRKSARSVAAGGSAKTLSLVLWIVLAGIFFICLGITLPRAIFNPTDINALSMYFNLGAWATNSWLGGAILGLICFGISLVVAVGTFSLLVLLPRSLKRTKLEKSLRFN